MRYTIARVEEVEPAGPAGVVRFMRRELEAQAFGVNWFELPPGAEGREHDESRSGQEEVNVVVAGSGVWRIDGEEVPVTVGRSFASIPPPCVARWLEPTGMTFIGIGARPGSYEPRGPF